MHFTDAKNRTWEISISLAEVEAIQDATGIDLGNIENFSKLGADTKTFAAMLWALIAEQAEKLKLDPLAVKKGFDAEATGKAREAVQEELLLFFRKPPSLMRLKEAMEQRGAILEGQAKIKLEEVAQEIESGKLDKTLGFDAKKVDDLLASLRSATGSAESLESIPAASP